MHLNLNHNMYNHDYSLSYPFHRNLPNKIYLFAAAIAVMALDLAQTLIFYRCPHCGWLLPFRHWSVPHCCPGCGRELNAPGR